MEFGCTIMTVQSESNVYAKHKKRRVEPCCSVADNKSNVCEMHKKREKEIRCTITTVWNDSKVPEMQKKVKRGQVHSYERDQGLCKLKKSRIEL